MGEDFFGWGLILVPPADVRCVSVRFPAGFIRSVDAFNEKSSAAL